MVSITYAVIGILGGILLALNNKYAITFGLVIFFFKIVLDWTDGHLARVTDKTSLTGMLLDPYGSLLGDIAFHVGMGFYVASYNDLFLYLIPFIPLLYLARLKSYSEALVFRLLINRELKFVENDPEGNKKISSLGKYIELEKYKNYYNTFNSFLDDRARSIDFICLLIFLEIHFALPKVTWIISILFIFKQLILFLISFYVISRGGWMENKVVEKDYSKAAKWLNLATVIAQPMMHPHAMAKYIPLPADQGNGKAQTNLGCMYETGIGDLYYKKKL